MNLYVPNGLPAADELRREGVEIAFRPNDGALRIGLVNLMPDKPATERQIGRMLAGEEDVALSLHLPSARRCRNADAARLARFYSVLRPRDLAGLDGMIVTGAPVERLDFEKVEYWPEIVALMDRARALRLPTLGICWAGQAMLHLHHGVAKRMLPRKAFGLFTQEVMAPASPLLAGLGHAFTMPVSRHTTVSAEEVLACRRLTLAAASPTAGPAIVEDRAARATAVFNHFEYEADTLEREHRRDRMRDLAVEPPVGGTPETAFWRRAGRRFYANWLDMARRAAGAERGRIEGEIAA